MLSNKSIAIVVVNSVLLVLGTIVVALRVCARRSKTLNLEIDDFLIIAALAIVFCHCAAAIACSVRGGIGFHAATLQPHTVTTFLKFLFALQFTYLLSVTMVRLSILFFYRRIFATPKFKLAVNIQCVVAVAWFIAFSLATLLQVTPISGNWYPAVQKKGRSINAPAMYMATAALEVPLDVLTLALPLSVIWRLQMRMRQKCQISGIFLVGSFVCVASALRLYYLTKHLNPSVQSEEDLTYNLGDIGIWSAIEPCMGLVCACLPTLGPIMHKQGLQSIISSLRNLLAPSGDSRDGDASFIPSRRDEFGAGKNVYTWTGPVTTREEDDVFLISKAEPGPKPQSRPDDLPLTGIHVDNSHKQNVERRKE